MMKALFHYGKSGAAGLQYGEIEQTAPASGEVRVRIKTAGLNHRDLFVPDRHDAEAPAVILGSDGAGIVDALGAGVDKLKTGDEVIINPALNWEENSEAPPKGFEILGVPAHGTFAEYINVPAENAVMKPKHLDWQEAGVLALSAMTAYRALFTRGGLKSGMTVFIPGATGGAGTLLLQFAAAAGASVYVTSRSEEKRRKALELGADKAIDSESDWDEELDGEKVDLVIESVGAATFNQSLDQLRRGGTLVAFGASAGDTVDFNLRKFFYGQYNLLGSTMASGEELREMLDFIAQHDIKPVMDKRYDLSEYDAAFDRMENAGMMGKIVFNV